MKQPRRPTREEKIIMSGKRLEIKDWLVVRDMKDMLVIINRLTQKINFITKAG